MTWQQILIQTGIITGLLSLLGIIIKGRIIKKIEEFKKALEWETRKREQVAQIAELVSLWIKKKYFPACDDNQVRFDAQKKYWELALWLPAPVLKKLNEAFTKSNAGDYKEAMILARKIIVGEKDDVRAEELVHWPSIDAG
jgi:hypothetical protein